eukprot:13473046-Ditylum_brightwellii.AAC.1
MNDLKLLVSYHKTFIDLHFTFLQLSDPRTGNIPAFQSCQIAIHYYLVANNLEAMMDNKTFELLSDEDKIIQDKKINTFLKFALAAIKKHFHVWLKDPLFLGLWSEQPLA